MTDETIKPSEETQAEDVSTPGNQVPAGAQVPGVDVTTGEKDGLTEAEPEVKEPEAPAPDGSDPGAPPTEEVPPTGSGKPESEVATA